MNYDFINSLKWTATIGDPSLLGWLTVAAYFITAMITFRVFLSSQQLFSGVILKKQRIFWLIISLVMLFLSINKQLDLQSLLTAIGEYYAHLDGWYENRRDIQAAVIIGIIVSLFIGMLLFMYHMRAILKTNWLAIIGLFFLLMFVTIRATSFHHMDTLINTYIYGVRVNWLLELPGIAAIAFSALFINKNQHN